MALLHTAEIHRLMGTPVTLDLGETVGLLSDIKTQVGVLDTVAPETGQLPAIATATMVKLPGQVQDLSGQLAQTRDNVLAAIGTSQAGLLADLHDALGKTADSIVQRLAATSGPRPFAVGERAAQLVRLLVQAAALALDKSPGEPYQPPKKTDWKENVAIDALREAAATALAEAGLDATSLLGQRVLAAFARFDTTLLADRSLRFVSIHALIPEVAAAL